MGINFVYDCVVLLHLKEQDSYRETTTKNLMFMDWLLILWCQSLWVLLKGGVDGRWNSEAHRLQEGMLQRGSGVCVDSWWQQEHLLRKTVCRMEGRGVGVIMAHPTESYYLKTVLGWNDIVMGGYFMPCFQGTRYSYFTAYLCPILSPVALSLSLSQCLSLPLSLPFSYILFSSFILSLLKKSLC